METMKFELGYEIINSYKRLAYEPWYALAEFIDNSTQAYFNSQPLMDAAFAVKDEKLTVNIEYRHVGHDRVLIIEDNSTGMSREDLERAVIIGKPPVYDDGRSKYGLGLKTASFWFGNQWSVQTKKLGESVEHIIEVDARRVAKDGSFDYRVRENVPIDLHYTKIEIWDLNQNLYTTTISRTKDFLRSMYRIDISNGVLDLKWKGESLEWNYDTFFKDFATDKDGIPLKKEISFKVGERRVTGWAGVLYHGTRDKAGFSVIKSNRVIIGWPKSYRPKTIFGEQEGGSNDLVNQRLTGELFLDDFDVSHTKDAIIFEDDDKSTLENKLLEECGELRIEAKKAKKPLKLVVNEDYVEFSKAVAAFEEEINSNEISDFLETFEIPDEELIEANNEVLVKNIGSKTSPALEVSLGSLFVRVFISDEISFNDPYFAVWVKNVSQTLDVVVNKSHPYWTELKTEAAILDYLRHCVYDGVAEWKAYKMTGRLQPDTIKYIKDNLLRVPFRIKN